MDINRLEKISRAASAANGERTAPAEKPMTVARIDQQLGGQLGRPEMGFLNNVRGNRHARGAQLEAWKKISSEKYEQMGALAVDALKAEAQLIREKLRVEWNHQFAALAERAAVGEMTVTRKLEAVLEAGRELLFGDRADAIERLEQRHAAGRITDDDFAGELRHLFDRYGRLLAEFVAIVDERGTGVRTAFRTNTNNPERSL